MPFISNTYTKTKDYNSGSIIFPTDLNSIQDDLGGEANSNATAYRTVRQGGGTVGAVASTAISINTVFVGSAPSGNFSALFYFNPADYPVTSRTVKVRLRLTTKVANVTAPGVNFTLAFTPVTAVVAGALTFGANTATAVVNTPTANSLTQAVGTEVTAPAAGFFILQVTPSGTTAASSSTLCSGDLQVRQL